MFTLLRVGKKLHSSLDVLAVRGPPGTRGMREEARLLSQLFRCVFQKRASAVKPSWRQQRIVVRSFVDRARRLTTLSNTGDGL